MKRPIAILCIAVLTALIIPACGSTIPAAGGTSIVMISIGESSDLSSVRLKAEQASLWTRIKHRFADLRLTGEAQAYIPSVVDSIRVTVSAPDMATVVGTDSIARGQTTATVRIEVPNGTNRTFVVEGIRGVDGRTYFRGTVTTSLTGADLSLPVTMGFVGPGIWVSSSRPVSANTPTCGSTLATACATITYALASRTSGTDAIIVSGGTYTAVVGAGDPALQLKAGTALLCTGLNQSTVINYGSLFGATAVYGADGASIDNCRIIVGTSGRGIVDRFGGSTTLAEPMRINGNRIEVTAFSAATMIGIDLYSDSPVTETTVAGPGTSAIGSVTGIQVNAGRSEIRSSSVTGFPTAGITLSAGAGAVVVSDTTVTGNTTGISVATTNRPTLSGNRVSANGTGISISAGTAEVTASTIQDNTGAGVMITGGSPRITTSRITRNNTGISIPISVGATPTVNENEVFCNTAANADLLSSEQIDLRNNAWDRDATTSPPGPIVSIGNCVTGNDICARGTVPQYQPFRSAVPGGCVILGKPQP